MYDYGRYELDQICNDLKTISRKIRDLHSTSNCESDCIKLSSQLDKITDRLKEIIIAMEDDGK